MSISLSTRARSSVERGDLRSAVATYEELQHRFPAQTWEREIVRLRTKLKEQPPPPQERLDQILRIGLGIEQIYAVNLQRRPDRMARLLRELTHQGLKVTRIDAVDAATSEEVARVCEAFRRRNSAERRQSSAHVPDAVMARYRKTLPPGVFAYLLSQSRALQHARQHGYRRILLLDDDVFFASDAATRLAAILPGLPKDWKILLLGASEYADRNGPAFQAARVAASTDLYHPIAGETCGSFAVAYDVSVYDDLQRAIDEADGTFDNVVLGSIYRMHRDHCFVIDPAVCIPDVSESDIRDGSRTQQSHSMRMKWEFLRYEAFTAPMTVAVLVSDFRSLRLVESLLPRMPGRIHLNLYYASDDGLRPVVPGRGFAPRDAQAVAVSASNGEELRRKAVELRVPAADAVMLWPGHRIVNDQEVLSLFARQLGEANVTGTREGAIDGVVYCLDAGVAPQRGLHSIVVPCYRQAEHVWPTIASALAQDASQFEIIVVNDNPEDANFKSEILQRVQSYRDASLGRRLPSVRVHDHRINRNASAARNTGFLLSAGEFVSFLDDDDHFEPGRLSCVEPALSEAPAHIGACYCGYTGAWNGARDEGRFPAGELSALVLTLRYAEHYMCTNTVTFRRTAFARLCGFNESYRRHQDLEMMVRFFNEFEIAAVRTFAVHNRPNPVPETFIADIPGLCKLKQQFLRDFRRDIVARGNAFVDEVIDAHARDITKRDRTLAPNALGMVDAFLRSTLGQ